MARARRGHARTPIPRPARPISMPVRAATERPRTMASSISRNAHVPTRPRPTVHKRLARRRPARPRLTLNAERGRRISDSRAQCRRSGRVGGQGCPAGYSTRRIVMGPWWGRNAARAARVKLPAMTRSGWVGSYVSAQHNHTVAVGACRAPSSSVAPGSAASFMCGPPMTRPTPCASSVCLLWSGSAPGWCLPVPSAPGWGSGGCAPGHPAALLAVEEARARSVRVPVTGAGSLVCVGAVIGPDRRLPCRAGTPGPGRLTSAMSSRTAECDQPPGTGRTAG
jgi:hypothetical protein